MRINRGGCQIEFVFSRFVENYKFSRQATEIDASARVELSPPQSAQTNSIYFP